MIPPDSTPRPLLQAIDLSRTAHDGTVLLRATNLHVATGELLVCMGKSGSGKSVLLRSLAALDASNGTLLWRNASLRADQLPRFRSQVMYVAQTTALPEGTVEEALREPFAWFVYRDRSFARQEAVEWLERFGRDESLLRAQTPDLSGGETQIVALTRALLLSPTILLLDEPTSAMDAETTGLAEAAIRDWLRHDERAIVWVTHNAEQAARLATRRVELSEGQVLAHG